MIAVLLMLSLPTPLERATPDFYGAVGPRVTVAWSLRPEGAEWRLTLTVTGFDSTSELERPPLETLPAWQAHHGQLQLFPLDDRPASPGVFHWRLRRKSPGAATVPELAYAYYRPGAPAGERFRTTYAEAIWVPTPQPAPAEVVRLPDTPAFGVPRYAWLVALPLAWAGCRLWSPRPRPMPVEFRRLMDALDADPEPKRVGEVVRAALGFGVGPALRQATAPELDPWAGDSLVAEARQLLADCDAARFGPRGAGDLAGRAESVVRRLALRGHTS